MAYWPTKSSNTQRANLRLTLFPSPKHTGMHTPCLAE